MTRTGDTQWQAQPDGGVTPERVGGGSRRVPVLEAPSDGQPYARQDRGWVLAPQPEVGEAPQDGSLYLRGNAGWSLYVPPTIPVQEAPVDGVKYARVDGGWEPLSPITGDLSVGQDVIAQGFVTIADPSSGLGLGNRNYNDDRYAGSTETWYRLSNSFSAGNAVQVFLSSGIKDDFGPRLFSRSSDRLYPVHHSARHLYMVAAYVDNISDWSTAGNRMLSVRKNGATVQRMNENSSQLSAMAVSCVVTLSGSDYAAVEVRIGHNSTADVYLQLTNMGPA